MKLAGILIQKLRNRTSSNHVQNQFLVKVDLSEELLSKQGISNQNPDASARVKGKT